MNKKGGFGIILFFFALLSVLVIGFIAAMAMGVLNYTSNQITPIMEDLGMVDTVNVSQGATYAFGTLDTFINAMPWVVASAYIMALVFCLVFIFLVGYNPHPAFIALFISLMVLLIFGCVIMSNMYQDVYTGTDVLATELQSQTMLSFLILNSPIIMAVIAVIGGIIMFTRISSFGGGGGI
jgi:hypothetical protein